MIITKSMVTVKWFAKVESLKAIWHILSPRRRRQLLGLQILSLAGAVGEVANLGALLREAIGAASAGGDHFGSEFLDLT